MTDKRYQVKLESTERDINSLIESVAQMYYLKWSWTGDEKDKEKLLELDNVSDNGNNIWIKGVDSNKKFETDTEIAEKISAILEKIIV